MDNRIFYLFCKKKKYLKINLLVSEQQQKDCSFGNEKVRKNDFSSVFQIYEVQVKQRSSPYLHLFSIFQITVFICLGK